MCVFESQTEICTGPHTSMKSSAEQGIHVQLVKTEGLFFFMCFLSFVTTTVLFSSFFKFYYTLYKIAYSITCDPMPVAASQKQVRVYRE